VEGLQEEAHSKGEDEIQDDAEHKVHDAEHKVHAVEHKVHGVEHKVHAVEHKVKAERKVQEADKVQEDAHKAQEAEHKVQEAEHKAQIQVEEDSQGVGTPKAVADSQQVEEEVVDYGQNRTFHLIGNTPFQNDGKGATFQQFPNERSCICPLTDKILLPNVYMGLFFFAPL